MTSGWDYFCLEWGDALLGWSLALPRDLTLLVLVVISVALMLIVRRLTASLSLLRQINDDERRLKELIAEAKQNADTDALARHRAVRARVAGVRFQAELVPALVSLLPLAVLLTWAGTRVGSLPNAAKTPFVFSARLPASSIGEIAHLVPAEDLEVDSGWIREIHADDDREGFHGIAEWTLTADASPEAYPLRVRFRNDTLRHPVLVGQSTHLEPRIEHDGHALTQITLTEYRPLQCIPGWSLAGIPPWVVGYIALALPLFLWGKRLIRLA